MRRSGGAAAWCGGGRGRGSGRCLSAEGGFAVDQHADASGGAETGKAASEAPDGVLGRGELGGQMERQYGFGGAVSRGARSSGADGNLLPKILGAGANDAGQFCSQRRSSRDYFTDDTGGGGHDSQR